MTTVSVHTSPHAASPPDPCTPQSIDSLSPGVGGLISMTCGGVGGGGGCGGAHTWYGWLCPEPPFPPSRLLLLRLALAIGAVEASSTTTREATANRVFILPRLLLQLERSAPPFPCSVCLLSPRLGPPTPRVALLSNLRRRPEHQAGGGTCSGQAGRAELDARTCRRGGLPKVRRLGLAACLV